MKANTILSKGFFPQEFPGCFDSVDFKKSLGVNNDILESAPKSSHSIKTSIPKSAGFRRNITIPNPKHFTLLAKYLDEKSDEINRLFSLSQISMSISVTREDSTRSIVNSHLYEEVIEEKIIKGYSSKFLITTDISKFYSSIYTHSIPWAIHGKSESKRKRSESLWGNKVDRLVRNMQDGQTLGIPIGPDTSRVISEIIGVALDKIINGSCNNLNGIRYIDDFFIYADSYSEAESILNKINRALRAFELTSNEAKSSIQPMPASVENLNLQQVQNFKIRKGVAEQKADIIHLYNITIDIKKRNPQENAFSYILVKISPLKIYEENWNIVESIFLQVALAEPINLMRISQFFISYKSYGYSLNFDKIKTAFLKIAQNGIDNNFGFEVCWTFWLLNQLEISITEEMKNLPHLTDPLAILSILIARESGIYLPTIDLRSWNNMLDKTSLYDENWLLSYEAESRSWLQNQNGLQLISGDAYFNYLKNKNISFLNLDSDITPIDEDKLIEETDIEHELTSIYRSRYDD